MSLKKLHDIRQQIADLKSKLADVAHSPLPLSDIESNIHATVDNWASRFDVDYLARGFAEPGAVIRPEDVELACAGEAAKWAIFAAWADPAGFKARLINAAKGYAAGKGGIPEQDRPAIARRLEAQVFELEVEEERIVCQLEQEGIECYRRGDIDPSIVLAAD